MARISRKLGGVAPDVFRLETSDSDGYVQDWHTHDCHMLLLPRRGGLLLATEEAPRPSHLSCQSFSMVPAHLAHTTQAAPGRQRHVTLYVDGDYWRRQVALPAGARLHGPGFAGATWQVSDTVDGILRLVEQMVQTSSHEAFQRQSPHLHHLLFEECARLMACAPALAAPAGHRQTVLLVRDIQSYVAQHLADDLSVAAIGHQFHLSRRHLSRVFMACTDETLVDFTNRTRVETAARLVATTSRSILDISLAVGIDSPSYLARLFKRYLGMPPSALRRGRGR